MPVYMVDRELPGFGMEQLAGAQQAAIQTCNEMTTTGKPVRYIRTTFVPGESHCMCLFEAPDEDLVREANQKANLPYNRIVPAVDLTPIP